MKKFLTILFISFLTFNTTFASLTIKQETNLKTQTQKAYNSFEKKLSKLDTTIQINKLNTVIWKIDILLKKKLSDKNRLVLTHLNELLKARKNILEWEIKTTNSNTTESKSETQTSTNSQGEENLTNNSKWPLVYTERWSVWGVDTKAQQAYDQAQVDAIKSSDLNMQLYTMIWPTNSTVSNTNVWAMKVIYSVLSKWVKKWVNDEIITRAYIDWNEPNSRRLRDLEKKYWKLDWITVFQLHAKLYNQYLWYFKDWKLLDPVEFAKANSDTQSTFSLSELDSDVVKIYYSKLWYYLKDWKAYFDASKVSPEIQALEYIDVK